MPKNLIRTLFPIQPRQFHGQRWVNITLRCIHLIGVAGIGGGFLFQLEPTSWKLYWHLTLVTGVALSLIYIWSSASWLVELKGMTIVLKVALLGLALAVPDLRAESFIGIIVISGLIAHAPAWVRAHRVIRLPAMSESGS